MTGEKPARETIKGKVDLSGGKQKSLGDLIRYDAYIGFLSLLTCKLSLATFKYPSRPDTQVLNGLTVGANPGQVIALVGPR